jgi:predicted DNA binding CopG/RHH family protein
MAETSKRPPVPKFRTEAEEAQWWYDHRDMVEKEFMAAIRNGTVGRGIAQRLASKACESKNITIRMPVADIDRARVLAEKRGVGYQTYMKMLLHEALGREARKSQ